MFIALGSGTNTIAYSSNGIDWTGIGDDIFDVIGYCAAWNGSMWVAGGYGSVYSLAYSTNGIDWTGVADCLFASGIRSVAWNGTEWIAVGVGAYYGDPFMATSPDGINWTIVPYALNFIGPYAYGIWWTGTVWVVASEGETNSISYSYDGDTWYAADIEVFAALGNGVAWNGSMAVAVGAANNKVAYSSNGINWTGLGDILFNVYGYGIAYGNGRWVATGDNDASENTIAYSDNGIDWTGVGNTIIDGYCRGVAFDGSIWVTGGWGSTNLFATSPDGENWTGRGTGGPFDEWYGIAADYTPPVPAYIYAYGVSFE